MEDSVKHATFISGVPLTTFNRYLESSTTMKKGKRKAKGSSAREDISEKANKGREGREAIREEAETTEARGAAHRI